MNAIMGWLLGEALPYILAAGAAVAGLFMVRQSGKAAGRKDAEIEQLEATAKAREKANEVDRELSALDNNSVRHRAGDWVRGKDRR